MSSSICICICCIVKYGLSSFIPFLVVLISSNFLTKLTFVSTHLLSWNDCISGQTTTSKSFNVSKEKGFLLIDQAIHKSLKSFDVLKLWTQVTSSIFLSLTQQFLLLKLDLQEWTKKKNEKGIGKMSQTINWLWIFQFFYVYGKKY